MTDFKRVTLYKIKTVSGFEDFLIGSNYDPVNVEDGVTGLIKYEEVLSKNKNEDDIPWLVFLNSGHSSKKYEFKSRNKFPRAVMALRIETDGAPLFFAATFGQHADSYIEKDQIVYDFGIRVGMNICHDDGLRRIQTTGHEAISKQTERQASSGAPLSVFGINSDTEFLRTISGSVKEPYKEKVESFKGKDSITIKFPKDSSVSWSYLVETCKQFEDRYWSTDYKNTQFKSYDNLRHENDPAIIEQLDEILCRTIEAGELTRVHLAPPEFVEGDLEFAYAKAETNEPPPPTFEDLRITDIISVTRRRLKDLTAQRLKSWKIFIYNNEHHVTYPKWNAYKCLVAEVDLGDQTFVLSNGQWREISKDLKAEVDAFINTYVVAHNVPYLPADVNIWSAKHKQNREDVFNSTAGKACSELYVLDKSKITIAGSKSYEVCDLIHADGSIIHVKRYSSGAASISHLFTQCKFYADAFLTDTECRSDMRTWINDDNGEDNTGKDKARFLALIPEKSQEVVGEKYTVVFCILYNNDKFSLSDLPFMSRYELMLSQRYLTEHRKFKVGVALRKVIHGAKPEEPADGAD